MYRFSHFSILSLLLCLLTGSYGSAQNTVGLISHVVEKAAPGYNLFFPHNQSTVFLVDNCGRLVHEWPDDPDIRPGNAVYLLDDGRLVKCKRPNNSINDPIWAGGGGATVEIRSWENELLHSFTLNDSLYRLHHDVAPMPNGNILMIAWARKTREEALAAGRNPALLPKDELWSESVLEWDPAADSIVWEWHVWDHLVQDYDAVKNNFGTVAGHPERIDINYDNHKGHPDWLHVNGIDYNPVLDQLVLSVPYFNEVWVIDHSTTTAESASSSGGRAGRGGDLLYRWGNPAAYRQGTQADQKLFFQHDIHWPHPDARPEEEGFSELAVFNNRLSPDSSTANVFLAPFDTLSWSYAAPEPAFGPAGFQKTMFHPGGVQEAVSASVSSLQALPNGNYLILSGRWGYAYELTPDDEVVWEYRVPIQAGAPASQGVELAISDNLTFRMMRYPADLPAFAGKSLEPLGYIELNPNEGFCGGLVSDRAPLAKVIDVRVYPNPVVNQVVIEKRTEAPVTTALTDLTGKILKRFPLTGRKTTVDVSALAPGMYFFRIGGATVKFVKQ